MIEDELEKNSEKEELNPQKVAEKYLEGDLPGAPNSYTGYGPGSSSLQDTKTIRRQAHIVPNKEENLEEDPER
ncbi:MAG: hypothetical protein GY861_17535 [bacterium]|nr:hypothetical protein [bacterium]